MCRRNIEKNETNEDIKTEYKEKRAKDGEYCKTQLELMENCANSAYIYQFLDGSGNASDNSLPVNGKIKAQYKADAEKGTWTRGYVLYHTIKDNQATH